MPCVIVVSMNKDIQQSMDLLGEADDRLSQIWELNWKNKNVREQITKVKIALGEIETYLDPKQTLL